MVSGLDCLADKATREGGNIGSYSPRGSLVRRSRENRGLPVRVWSNGGLRPELSSGEWYLTVGAVRTTSASVFIRQPRYGGAAAVFTAPGGASLFDRHRCDSQAGERVEPPPAPQAVRD